ncbi:hypothetical protein [Pseudomonas cavernicola]|uniref:hypothetical protein n=1 Tax=Pseudomonas cavernicola TaxID=2320866 RepID=UPI0011C432E9|nr:hypothetical protein [Pseudomonas cavernicola]
MNTHAITFSSIGVIHPTNTPSSPNFKLPSWPPPADFPVVVDQDGNVISRISDHIWNISIWAGKSLHLNFGDGPQRRSSDPVISKENADILRLVSAFWLWGPKPSISADSLKARFTSIFNVFRFCSSRNIVATQLSESSAIDELHTSFTTAAGEKALVLLHDLFEQSKALQFVILNKECLRRFAVALPEHQVKQTAYIPPRIWSYQVTRLKELIDDYLNHEENIKNCYMDCLAQYLNKKSKYTSPFGGYKPAEKFQDVTDRYGISHLLYKWILPPGNNLHDRGRGLIAFSSFLTLTSRSALNYTLNFSLMRIDEGWNLRSDCFSKEVDPHFGHFCLLRGETTKTIQDSDANWITSPSVELAVNVMASIAKLRMAAAKARNIKLPQDHFDNPYLITRSFEPWSNHRPKKHVDFQPSYASYDGILDTYPKLFDKDILTITPEDLQIAKIITPSLDLSTHNVGAPWRFSWHQLRRTGAVNMQASGLVSDSSAQYQLKHSTRFQTLYYGQGYSHVRLNESARVEYLTAMYRFIGREVSKLLSNQFVSPYGENHKSELLKLVSNSDDQKLTAAAKNGQVSWHPILLGACCYKGVCAHGGIDNIIRCGGGDGQPPCAHTLYDKEKRPEIIELQNEVSSSLKSAEPGSPFYQSLQAQYKAAENALNVIAKSK